MKKIVALLLIITLLGFFINVSVAQVASVDRNNLSLENSTFNISPVYNFITVQISSLDSVSEVYPQYEILLEDNSIISTANLVFGSILAAGYPEYLIFDMAFMSSSFGDFTEINGFLHVLDSVSPGDTIANCYLPITIILTGPTSVEENAATKGSFKVMPNPSESIVSIEFSNPQLKNCSLVLFNSNGVVVRKTAGKRSEKVAPDREDLAARIYYFHISNDSEIIVSGKLISE
jgi:Secretion system C-terminal sorting domain